MYRSSVSTEGRVDDLPAYIYYNADIISNESRDRTEDSQNVVIDPPARFNETRDTALVKDSSKYYFSIVRFTMNGANRDLPLFIPSILEGTGQTNPNVTTYGLAIPYAQKWAMDIGTRDFAVAPPMRRVLYVPETQNTVVAPTPPGLQNQKYRGVLNLGTYYQPGDIVATSEDTYGVGQAPFFQLQNPAPWVATKSYQFGAWVTYAGVGYRCILAPPGVSLDQPPPNFPASWVRGLEGAALLGSPNYFTAFPANQGGTQVLNTRYYWVYTYQHMVDLVNKTIYDESQLGAAPGDPSTCAYQDTYNEFYNQWVLTGTADPFPYATFGAFCAVVTPPQIVYDTNTQLFSIYGDSDGFGQRLRPFVPASPGAELPPLFRLFFNTNLYGLFANFKNTYYNDFRIPQRTMYYLPTKNDFPAFDAPEGYVNEILFPNKFWTNVSDYRLAPYSGTPPLGYVPPSGFIGAAEQQQKPYWVATQDYKSIDSLWSPIGSIVFCSTLLPVRAEQTGPPVVLGSGNLGDSAATAQSAFQPIVTDIAIDTSAKGAHEYRQFIYYAPTAEYRIADMGESKQDIRNIDIQVYWKSRLDAQLYPITLFNQSSVSIKVMFRHKGVV